MSELPWNKKPDWWAEVKPTTATEAAFYAKTLEAQKYYETLEREYEALKTRCEELEAQTIRKASYVIERGTMKAEDMKMYQVLEAENAALKTREAELKERLGQEITWRTEEIRTNAAKLYEAEKREAALIKAIQLGIGFCVDFRQNKDWENHPEIGILFAKLTIALKNNP